MDRHALYLRYLAEKGANERYGEFGGAIKDRIEFELSVIEKAGFPEYFLVVYDILRFCRERGIPTGPGRGSICGSSVAYATYITDVEPIRFGIPFERFLHLERVAQPDIDLDICQARRGEVIEYLHEKYGADSVAQIITFGTLLAKQVTKDVCRVLHVDDHTTGQKGNYTGERLAALIPEGGGADQTKLQEFIASPEGREFNDSIGILRVPYNGYQVEVLDTCLRLEGLRRHGSVHAAGVVIADRPLIDIAPLYRKNQQDSIKIQYDMKDAEEVGLLKFDVLGLRTVTVIGEAEKLIREHSPDFNIKSVRLDDGATFDLLSRGDTGAVFQLEGEGITGACTGLRPDRFEDIIALIALYRPGPMEQLPNYIHRKHGEESVSYAHQDLKPILERTYGLIVYQEQVMGISRTMAGFTAGEADLFRKAIGKKDLKLIAEEIEKFSRRAEARGYSASLVKSTAEQISYFGRYGFNLGHATGYGFITYWTAYLKANYPTEFFCANLNSQIGVLENITKLIKDARDHGISVLPPDINQSGIGFTVAGRNQIRFGLGAIKGLGENFIKDILDERDAHTKRVYRSEQATKTRPDGTEYKGRNRIAEFVPHIPSKFEDIHDFCARLPSVPVNAKEALAVSGAFGVDLAIRKTIVSNIERINTAAKRGIEPILMPAAMTDVELMKRERETMGFYVTGHPLEFHRKALERYGAITDGLFDDLPTDCVIAGIVTAYRTHQAKNGEMAWITLETGIAGAPDITSFASTWLQAKQWLKKDEIVIARARKEKHPKFGWGLKTESLTRFDPIRPNFHTILLSKPDPDISDLVELAEMTSEWESGKPFIQIALQSERTPVIVTARSIANMAAAFTSFEDMGWLVRLDHHLGNITSIFAGSGNNRLHTTDLPIVKTALKILGGKVLGELRT
jgi:DNA polymerase III subunit alpha